MAENELKPWRKAWGAFRRSTAPLSPVWKEDGLGLYAGDRRRAVAAGEATTMNSWGHGAHPASTSSAGARVPFRIASYLEG
jgi:hypothetical protein